MELIQSHLCLLFVPLSALLPLPATPQYQRLSLSLQCVTNYVALTHLSSPLCQTDKKQRKQPPLSRKGVLKLPAGYIAWPHPNFVLEWNPYTHLPITPMFPLGKVNFPSLDFSVWKPCLCFPCKVICLSPTEDQRNRIKKVPSQAASYNKCHRLETAMLRWASLHLVIKCHMKYSKKQKPKLWWEPHNMWN